MEMSCSPVVMGKSWWMVLESASKGEGNKEKAFQRTPELQPVIGTKCTSDPEWGKPNSISGGTSSSHQPMAQRLLKSKTRGNNANTVYSPHLPSRTARVDEDPVLLGVFREAPGSQESQVVCCPP